MSRIGTRLLLVLCFLLALAPYVAAEDPPAAGDAELDVIELKSGSSWTGRILKEDKDRVVLSQGSDKGGSAEITFRREDIRRIKRGAGGPAPRGGARALRDEHFLLRSGGRIVGTRRLELWSVQTGGKPAYRIRETRTFFAQGPQLPGTSTHMEEYVDLEFRPLLLSFREVGEASSDSDGPARYERNVSGRVRGGVWNGVSATGGDARPVKVPAAAGTRGRLGFREHLLRGVREVRLYDTRVLDPNAEGLVSVRAGFASIPLDATEKARGHEFHWEEGGRRLISFFHADTTVLREEIAEGVTAVPVSREQAEAARGDERKGPTDPEDGLIKLAEAGIGFNLPDRLWTWKPALPSPANTGWRVLGRLDTRVYLADVRIEWHPRSGTTETAPAQVEGWLVRRLRSASPDLRVVAGRRNVVGVSGAWQMEFSGTLKAESIRTIALVVDRPLGRVVLLLACPVAAWELCARVAGYAPDTSVIQWERHPDLLWRPSPGQDTFFGEDDSQTGEQRLPIHINRHGQRGPDYPLDKPSGELRVIFVGDSLTFGPGVRDEETYVTRYQSLCDADAGFDGTVRAVNAAANGYATFQYLRHAETQLERLDPDLYVVAIFFGNDMELVRDDQMSTPIWLDKLKRRSAVANYLRERMRESWVEERAERANSSIEEVENELLEYAGIRAREMPVATQLQLWIHSIEHLESIRDVTDRLGARLAVLLLPSHVVADEVASSLDFQTWKWFKAELSKRGFATVDPLPEMREVEELWLPFNRGHYTAEGHAAVARAFLRGTREHGLLDQP